MRKTILAATLAAILSGCASPATHQAMLVDRSELPSALSDKLKGEVYIRNVTGGKDTNPLGASQVDSSTFKSALENSFSVAGYRSVKEASRYEVDADLKSLEQPLFGFNFDVRSTVSYSVRTKEGTVVMPIVATGSASTSDAFVGVERLRIANERSIKENIKSFIKAMTERFGK